MADPPHDSDHPGSSPSAAPCTPAMACAPPTISARNREDEQARYACLFHNIRDAIFIANADTGVILDANAAAETLTGRSREELIGLHQSALHPPDFDQHSRAVFREHAVHGSGKNLDLEVLRKDGSRVPVNISASTFFLDGVRLVQGVFRDMSGRVRAQAELRDAQERYRRLVENLGARFLFYAHGPDGVFHFVSSTVKEQLGYTPEEFRRHFSDFLPDTPLNAKATEHTLGSIRGEIQPPYLVEVRNKAGSLQTLEITEVPVFDEQGKVVAVEGIGYDVTAKKELERQLIRSERMAAVGTLAAGVAHEFNNINAVILGFAELLARDLPEDSPLQHYSQRVVKAAQRAAALTSNLLTFAGDQREDVLPADLVQVVEDTLGLVSRQLEKEGVELVRRLEPVPPAPMDANQIGQVVLNLLLNAGHALIGRPERRITVSTRLQGETVVLTVEDTGRGIPAEHLSKVFTPFFSTKGVYASGDSPEAQLQGTGLGLSVSHTIASRHGGDLHLESTVGVGTVATLTLPLAPPIGEGADEPAPEVTGEPPPAPAGDGSRVLIVEDDQDVRDLLRLALENEGCTVFATGRSERGLELLARHRPEVVLVDLHMPTTSGADLIRRIRRLQPEAIDRLAVISGRVSGSDAEALAELGVRHVFHKPFALAEIKAFVQGDE